jgi:hypothetical protein
VTRGPKKCGRAGRHPRRCRAGRRRARPARPDGIPAGAAAAPSLPLPPLVQLAGLDRVAASAERLEVRLVEKASAVDERDLVVDVGGGRPQRQRGCRQSASRRARFHAAKLHGSRLRRSTLEALGVCVSRHADATARGGGRPVRSDVPPCCVTQRAPVKVCRDLLRGRPSLSRCAGRRDDVCEPGSSRLGHHHQRRSRARSVPSVSSSASSAAMSASERMKSKIRAFSSIRSRWVDFGRTTRSRCTHQRRST